MTSKPLDSIRVVEYATFHAGPNAGAILADLGAEVIKVEGPGGDPMRQWKEVSGISFGLPDGEGLLFQCANRNKKSICLDIRKEEGRGIFLRLIREADVFLTSLRKQTKLRLGIDYETLKKVNPRIVYASVSGFGSEGPESDAGGFDPNGQGRSGMVFVAGTAEPRVLHLGVLDQSTSIALSHAVLTALLVRERQGFGQEVHVSLYSAALWVLYINLVLAGCLSIEATAGDRLQFSPLRNYFRCRDGKWFIGTHHPEEKYWPAFCKATGQEHLLTHPLAGGLTEAGDRRRELVLHFDKVFATRDRDEWLAVLREHHLMFSPVQQIPEVLQDPQALANNYVLDFEHPLLGKVKLPGYPVQFSASPAPSPGFAPALGEDTDRVLKQMGYTEADLERLRGDGVIR